MNNLNASRSVLKKKTKRDPTGPFTDTVQNMLKGFGSFRIQGRC